MENETQILTIKKLHFTGKWVEFWFEEDVKGGESYEGSTYDLSSKSGYLWEAVEEADIYDEITTNGFKGKKLQWKKIGMNWEIDKFIKE